MPTATAARKLGCATVVAAGLFVASSARAVSFTFNGSIYETTNGGGTRTGSSVDHYRLTVLTPGTVTIDSLSWEEDDFDRFDHDLNTTETADVNGDGEIAFFDSHLFLFHDDGSLDVGDYIDDYDDSELTYSDGSIANLDAYASPNLGVGNYIVAIGGIGLTAEGAVSGFNDALADPVTADGAGNLISNDHGDYRLTFSGDAITVVPEPGTAALAVLGAGMMTMRRRGRR
jgi:hypothetical protein